jgi:predicted site-specific integrase-resolvase
MDDYDKTIRSLRKARDNYKAEFPKWVAEAGVSYSTVYKWLDRGQLPSVRLLREVSAVVKSHLAAKKSSGTHEAK